MNRPTIADLAMAAGVSVATVNRILGGSVPVRATTIKRVQDAAGEIGFYGLGVIDARKKETMPHYRLAFLLQQSHRDLYQLIATKIREAPGKDVTRRSSRLSNLSTTLNRRISPRG